MADEKERVWFEARYSRFLSRFLPSVEYDLYRCDDDPALPARYRLVEGYWEGDWMCWNTCRRVFHLSRRADNSSSSGFEPWADARFISLVRYVQNDPFRGMNLTAVSGGPAG